MTEFTQVATIPKTAQRCKAEGIGLSENQLRTLCARGGAETHPNGEKVPDLLAQPLRAAGAGHAPGDSAGGVREDSEGCGMRGRNQPGKAVRGRTGQAAFLRTAEAGWTRQNQRRGRALAVRSSAAKAAAPGRESSRAATRRESSRAATRRELRAQALGERR